MGITLDDILVLTGRLDDGAGFDTPRERFRRFLTNQATATNIGRAFIEQCQALVDEQHHRALQDLVVLLGKSLGFDATFGTYEAAADGLKCDGYWRSRGRLEVVIELRTNYTPSVEADTLARSTAAHAATVSPRAQIPVVGLIVLASGYPGRTRLEERLTATALDGAIRVVSVRSLLFLSDLMTAGRLTHDEVVRLLDTMVSPDFVIELIEGLAGAPYHRELERPVREEASGPGFGLATVDGDNVLTPEQFLEVVIGKRRIFGVRTVSPPGDHVRARDHLCFYVTGRGAVGKADVISIEPSGTGLRDGHQYSQLLRLDGVELYPDVPLAPDPETTLRLRAAQGDASAAWQPFMRIPEHVFRSLTQCDEQGARRSFSGEGSRSHE
jgi:hypothetical protein